MVAKIKPEDLDNAIQEQLDEFSADLQRNLNTNLEEVADKTAETLRKGGPYTERTGKYTPDWTYSERRAVSVMQTTTYTVHNRKHYQLAHLLEKGHVTRNGSRTRSFEHILPAEQAAEELAVEAVEKAVKAAGGE